MKIGIYSPYLDTAGGGEKYILTIAEILSKTNSVDVLLDQNLSRIGKAEIKEINEKRHNLDLSKVGFLSAPIDGSFLQKFFYLRKYDWFFYNTDGSVFFSTARNSIIHFQVPFENQVATSWWGRFKLNSWKQAIYNSIFTKDFIQSHWAIKGEVIYPPVDIEHFKPLKKKKQILNVGRFFSHTKVKKHDFMIEAFKKLVDKGLKDWSLHLAGGSMSGDDIYVEELKNKSKGYPIFFHPNISFTDLIKLYGESSIYWHAMGYEETDPKKFEHFGISTVESMAAGCVPIVINKGGQTEIVEDGKNGYLWDTEEELLNSTLKIAQDPKLQNKISDQAIARSTLFSKENFEKKIERLVDDR